jgi:signal transduction histidine kinase
MNNTKEKSPPSAADSRILVVSDNPAEGDRLRDLLLPVPHSDVVCVDSSKFLDYLVRERIDLVLMKITGSGGFAFAKRMKDALGANNFVPLILVSGLSSQDEKIAGLSVADDYITTPFHEKELLARVTVMLRIRQLQRDLLVLEGEKKLARTQLYLSARLASIGTFASGVAHELNNPLTAIMGFSGSILERMKREEEIDKDELEQYLSIIQSETVRCSEIVENLSQFAREGEAQINDFVLAECVDGAVRLVNSLAVKKNVAITKNVGNDLRVRADMRKLQQAIVHIATNSIDFCKPGGGTIDIAASRTNSTVMLRITDNGPGIAPDMLSKVFEPFSTTKEVGRGMGMGLAMCYVIMEECKGAIDVASEKGKGTTVTLQVPTAPEEGIQI